MSKGEREGLVHEKRRLAIEWTKWHIILANVFETNVQSCSLLVKVWFVDYQLVVKTL